MDRRTFLGALASGGAVALAGCTAQRETLHRVSATPEIPSGDFYHEPLRLDGRDKQFNLRYEVTADHPFDALLFGGQSDPEEFDVYRRTVETAGDERRGGGGRCGRRPGGPSGSGSGHGSGNRPSGGSPGGDAGGRPADAGCPEPSGWHSVMGARGRGEVNKPLRPGTHHFVVDNTHLGEATPEGTLRPTIDLAVRDFELFSG